MAHHGLVILFALMSAVCMAVGIVVRQRATMDVPQDHGVSVSMVTALVRKRLWWMGTGVAVAGYVCQALALTRGSLLVVQPLLVSSLLFALPLSARLAGRRVTRSEWCWAVTLTAALAVFVLMARPHQGLYRGQELAWSVAIAVIAPIVVFCVAFGARSTGRRRAMLIAVAVGALFGVTAVLTKLVVFELAEEGALAVLTLPALYLLATLGVCAVVLQQSAFHAGALQMSVPTMLVLEPVVAVLLGALVLNEHLTVSGYETIALPLTIAAMAAATIALGRDEGAYEEQLEAEMARRSPLPSAPGPPAAPSGTAQVIRDDSGDLRT
ncbi:MAG: DMT family transporter [Mycobacteriaceae bacterium]|nr:DMT family transporter [Mycobacteriaceae bacterium]